MAIDPSIALAVQPPKFESPVNMLSQAYALQNAAQQNRLGQMQMAEYERARAEEDAVRNYLRTADLAKPGAEQGLMQFGKTGLAYAKQVQDARTAALEMKNKQLKFQSDLAEQAGRIYSTVTDEASWQRARQKLAALGGDPSTLPETYDPNYIQSELAQALSVKDRAEQHFVSQNLGGTTRVIAQPKYAVPGMAAPAATVVPGSVAATTMTPYETGRLELENRRVGLEGQRVGLEGQRVGLAQEEAKLKREGIEGIAPKELQKREAAFPAATQAIKGFETKSDNFVKDLEALRDHPGLSQITGIAAGRLPGLTAEGRAAQALYDKIVAKGGFQALQDLRDASKTGGALGNVSNQEGKQLTASFAAIDRRQDAPDVKAALEQAIADVEGAKTRMREAYDSTYSYKSGRQAAPSALSPQDQEALAWANANPNDPRAAQIKRQLGAK